MQAISGLFFLFAGSFAKTGLKISLKNFLGWIWKIYWAVSGILSPAIFCPAITSCTFLQAISSPAFGNVFGNWNCAAGDSKTGKFVTAAYQYISQAQRNCIALQGNKNAIKKPINQ